MRQPGCDPAQRASSGCAAMTQVWGEMSTYCIDCSRQTSGDDIRQTTKMSSVTASGLSALQALRKRPGEQ